MTFSGPGFSRSYGLAFRPTPLSRQQVVSLPQSSCVSPVEQPDGKKEGMGEEPNHTTARKPGPLTIFRVAPNNEIYFWAFSKNRSA